MPADILGNCFRTSRPIQSPSAPVATRKKLAGSSVLALRSCSKAVVFTKPIIAASLIKNRPRPTSPPAKANPDRNPARRIPRNRPTLLLPSLKQSRSRNPSPILEKRNPSENRNRISDTRVGLLSQFRDSNGLVRHASDGRFRQPVAIARFGN